MSSPAAAAAAAASSSSSNSSSSSAVPAVSPSSSSAEFSTASSWPVPTVPLASLPNPFAHVKAVSIVPLQFPEPRKPVRYEDGWDYYRRIGSPKTVCAPMVNQSELAFRMLCRRYGTHLAVTPMFHSENFGKDPTYRADAVQIPRDASLDRPLVAQFCGNNPATVLKAARFVENWADAVDLNLGCPQGIAKRGHYGSFLLEESQLLHDIVSTLHQYLSIPVTCKIRIVLHPVTGKPDFESTIALVRMLQEAGAAMITIHGRSRFQLKDAVGACDFDLIRLVKQNASVPVFANGGIYTMRDVQSCLDITGVDGVMSSESLLCNPTLFSGRRVDSIVIAKEYMNIVHELEATGIQTEQSMVRAHLFKMLYQHVGLHHDLRDRLAHCDPADFDPFVADLEARFSSLSPEAKQAQLDTVPLWYMRHIPTAAQKLVIEQKAADKRAEAEAAAAAGDAGGEGMCDGWSMFEECCAEQQPQQQQQSM